MGSNNVKVARPVACSVCNKTISRRSDLPRHMKTHAVNREELMYTCPHAGCLYKTLQRSNLATHLNVHSRERPYECPTRGCDFRTSDPGSLTRHRKDVHAYEPTGRTAHLSALSRKEARRKRRISPYSSPSSSSISARSLSPLDSGSTLEVPPFSETYNIPDKSPLSALFTGGDVDEHDIKNVFAAYSTQLIARLPEVDVSLASSNAQYLPHSGSATMPEIEQSEQLRLYQAQQGSIFQFDDFYEPFPASPVYAISTVQSTVCHTAAPAAPTFLSPYDGASVPTTVTLPAYEDLCAVDVALYEYNHTQFSQPVVFTESDMDSYVQAHSYAGRMQIGNLQIQPYLY